MPAPDETPLPDAVLLITPPSVFLLDERVFVNLGILRTIRSERWLTCW